MMTESKYRVSVVVPTFKRPDMLMCCVTALMNQDFDATAYEVIIADDAACEKTRREVEAWAQEVRACRKTLRYVPVKGTHGPAAARNAGWLAACGEIIAFTDDDCIPTSCWLKAGVAAFSDGVVVVAGQLIVPLEQEHIPTDYERNAADLAHAHFVTANCFYRRDCLVEVGGFDERFTAAWREDSDLIFTLEEAFCNAFIYAPDAVVIHPLRPAPWGVSLIQQRKSMFNALLYKKHPDFYRERIQTAPPWHYYGIVGTLLMVIVALLNRCQWLAFVAACFWLFLTGRFCLQRLHSTSHEPRHVAEMMITSVLIPPLAIFWRLRGAIKFRVFFL